MVNGVSNSNFAGVQQPNLYAHQALSNENNYGQGGQIAQQPTMDEFVTHLEDAYKKGRNRKNLIGGTITLASLSALLGGTLLKSKWGRALSIAPLALTTLFFGGTTLAKNNQVPDFRGMINEMQGSQPAYDGSMHSHQA